MPVVDPDDSPSQVKPNDRLISNILGEFDQVAPIMRSESACASLVGAYAMPCTPAPALQDHDHLFVPPPSPAPTLPPPPPPPPRHERRSEATARSRLAPAQFQAPAPPAPAPSHTSRPQRAPHSTDQVSPGCLIRPISRILACWSETPVWGKQPVLV